MTSNQAADPKAPQPFDRRWLARAVIAIAQLMTALDATIVNIALPSAQRYRAFDDNARARVSSVGVAMENEQIASSPTRRRQMVSGSGRRSPQAAESLRCPGELTAPT
jgi:hypothetical protein